MAKSERQLDEMKAKVLQLCSHLVRPGKMIAACLSGSPVFETSSSKNLLEVMVVAEGYPPRLLSYFKALDDRNALITVVDAWVFERDVDRGFLGEVLAGRMIFPYSSLLNAQYFRSLEIKLKKRLIYELLENLVLDYPESSYQIRIKPEYFMYETMADRARIFPLLNNLLLEFSHEECKATNVKLVLPAYLEALKELEKEQVVYSSGPYIRACPGFIHKVKRSNTRFINLFRSGQRTLFASILGVFPQLLNILSQNAEFLSRFQRIEGRGTTIELQPSEQYLFVPTENGLVPLSGAAGIADFARRTFSSGEKTRVEVEDLGGILNDVFMIKVSISGEEKRAVAKRFRDWSSFKWFPLTLWSVGTRSFVVLGRSRLEREYAINQLLGSKGFAVPKILHVSESERLIIMEYVEGENLSKTIKKAAVSKIETDLNSDLEIVAKAGELLATVHAEGIALGDTKPENLLLSPNGRIFMLDFEQASRNGDKVWDVAEFLYYAGHYIPISVEVRRAELIAKAFIRGYLGGGGDIKTIKRAGTPKYTKVFSVFTLPHIMLAFSALCRKADPTLTD